ncbi:MAG: histidine--tRNA ligase [Fimbriimonadaceae bacterium]|nr:histidine--tRNA ligase [Fimbriimonadaceae bacterium]
MAGKYQAPRGTADIVPAPYAKEPVFEVHRWQAAEQVFRQVAGLYGYQEVRTPIFEDLDLFLRTSGETSDIVSKEMYDFTDKGGRHVALRPEGTAPAMRAYIEHPMGGQGVVTRLGYFGPVFRYNRPQKGRYRQFHQAGYELIGSPSPLADAEIIDVTVRFFHLMGLADVVVKVNSIGRGETRADYERAVLQHVGGWMADQDGETRAKAEKNPLRLLDTKDPDLRRVLDGLPSILGFLGDESKVSFEALQGHLREQGTAFEVDDSIVRGLDYYTDTVFEVVSAEFGALCGGGRYDGLVEQLGGPSTPSVGVGIGVERALHVAELAGQAAKPKVATRWYVVAATEAARDAARGLARELRARGAGCSLDLDGRSVKAQFKQADRNGAVLAAVIGDDELAAGTVSVKDLVTGEQKTLPHDVVLRIADD